MGRGTRQDHNTATGRALADRYEVGGLIGVGAAAHVYLAFDNHLGRDVAVKMLTEDAAADPDFAERFRREAKAIASFSHPNIVTIYDWGTAEGLDYMVMEYVPGGSVSTLLADEGRLPEDRALRLAEGTAHALAAAHSRGIVHRDIKPDNILLALDESPKVADFGIAWVPGLSHLTLTNAIFGTVSYISPEQARGETVDGRSDLYSLGVVLYRMLTGRLPFEGGSMVDVAVRHVQEQPEPPRSVRPDISPQTERLILKAMAKRPAERYQDATVLAEALEGARAALARKPTRSRRPRNEATVAAPLGLVRESVPRRPVVRPEREAAPSAWGRFLWVLPVALLALVVVAVALAAHSLTGQTGHHVASSGRGKGPASARPGAVTTKAPSRRHAGAHPKPTSSHPVSAPPASPAAVAHPTAVSQPAVPPAVSQPTSPPRSTGSSAAALPSGASSPQAAVIAFYVDVANHRFADAASLWSPSLQQTDPPAVYIDQRFSNTTGLSVGGVSLQSMDASGKTATVGVHVTETVGNAGATQVFVGSWQLVQLNGRWLLDHPYLRQVSAADIAVPSPDQGQGDSHGNGNGKAKGHAKHGQD